MTLPRRDWLATFADPAALSDLRDALRAMAAELDDCDPEECMHPDQRVHPFEVYQWIEREMHMNGQRPTRFEAGHRPRRWQKKPQPNLAVAG